MKIKPKICSKQRPDSSRIQEESLAKVRDKGLRIRRSVPGQDPIKYSPNLYIDLRIFVYSKKDHDCFLIVIMDFFLLFDSELSLS